MPTSKSKRHPKCKIATEPWTWGQEQEETFEQLKRVLTSPPVLSYPDYTKPFELHTDANSNGLGAVLY